MIGAIDPAVQRIKWRAFRVEPYRQAIRARRRPRFDDPHGLDMGTLHRLEEGMAGTEARSDPVFGSISFIMRRR